MTLPTSRSEAQQLRLTRYMGTPCKYCEPAPTVFQAVFYRDTGDDPIKRAAVLETYGICDLAYDVCMRHGVDQELADLLIQPCP